MIVRLGLGSDRGSNKGSVRALVRVLVRAQVWVRGVRGRQSELDNDFGEVGTFRVRP